MKDVYEKRANSGKLNLEKLLSKYKTFWIMSAPSLFGLAWSLKDINIIFNHLKNDNFWTI